MGPEEQKYFIRNLTKSIADSIVKAIDAGKVPSEWDGHELRELLYEKFDDSRSRMMNENKRGKRYQEFRNHLITHDI